ncbi:MAG: dihydropteroate synthase [Lachnospiraceae bacterium]|nr:dihydropteroate synthase [Lachnospiraceae bacterium]
MKIRNTEFDLKKTTYVMGILNVTPDSFWDGGLHNTPETAVEHALKMIKDGAAIIDIGGESTRPGFVPVEAGEEMERVIPVIKGLRAVSDIPISIDTTKAEVAAAALAAGADIVNTVAGLGIDDKMLTVVKDHKSVLVLTYDHSYVNPLGEALIEMAESVREAGIDEDKIIVDPGIGFGKTDEDNLRIMNELPIITQIGYPILLGTSRKSMIGNVLGVPEDKRLAGTLATTVLATLAGVAIVRVHDVLENIQAIRMTETISGVEDGSYQH